MRQLIALCETGGGGGRSVFFGSPRREVTKAGRSKLGTPVIQLDIDPDELGRNYPNTVSLHGDAKVTLQKLIDAVGKQPPRRAEWLEQVKSYVTEYWAESEPLRNSDAVPLRPERICKELEAWLPPRDSRRRYFHAHLDRQMRA